MTADHLTVRLADRSYEITCTHGDPAGLTACIRRHARTQVLLVTDAPLRQPAERLRLALENAGTPTTVTVLEAGEAKKNLATVALLYDRFAERQADRRSLVLALGGGVIGDLAGFVAATYNRGLPLFMVPTTLLAMVDSSVGGKVGVNHPRGKNLVGAFHQPCAVWIDTAYLDTLPDREYRSALAEVVKYGMILDPDLLGLLEQRTTDVLHRMPTLLRHLILQCCRLKATAVEQDERETLGKRVILNYGHTFAHAFETVAGYGCILHGEAVALGMACAARLAERMGRLPVDVLTRQNRLLERFGLPVVLPREWSLAEMLRAMYVDKKTEANRLRFVLPTRIGQVDLVSDVPEELVRKVLFEAAS